MPQLTRHWQLLFSKVHHTLAKVFEGWEDKIVRPILVNLVTALLFFLIAVVFKDPIFNYFRPAQPVKDWPILCIMEPVPNQQIEDVAVELFIVNVDPFNRYGKDELNALAKDKSLPNRNEVSSQIIVSMMSYLVGESITNIKSDDHYNLEKGSVDVRKLDSGEWELNIVDIKPKSIMKFLIYTSEKRSISSRASVESLPVRFSYARLPEN